MKKPTAEEIHEEQDARMRTQYYDPIELFPDRIDQLLNALNRVILFFKKKIFFDNLLVLDLYGSKTRD
jgi:hypothetical protein